VAERDEAARGGRRTFLPVVGLGLIGGIAAAIGGHKTMLQIPGSYMTSLKAVDPAASLQASNGVDFPLAGALALVTLAAWAVVLVSRGFVRRAMAVLTAAAAAGVVVVLVVGGIFQRSSAASSLSNRIGATDTVPLQASVSFWVSLVGALVSLVAAVAAARLAPAWPEMGTKYDAPGGSAGATEGAAIPVEDRSNLELWKSLDEGHDPTE